MTDVMVVDVGTRACLVEVEDAVAAASLATWVRAAGLPAEDVVPAARTVLLDGVDPAAVRELLPRWAARRRSTTRPARARRGPLRRPRPRAAWPTTGDARRRRSSTATRRWSSPPRSAGSPPASPTSPDCPPSAPCRGWSRRAPGCRRVGRARRHLVRRLPDRLARRLAADRHHRRRPVGRRPRRAGAPGPGHPGAVRGAAVTADGPFARRRGGRPRPAVDASRTAAGAGGRTSGCPAREHWTGARRRWPTASSAGDRTTP